jgi:hypothetical protein
MVRMEERVFKKLRGTLMGHALWACPMFPRLGNKGLLRLVSERSSTKRKKITRVKGQKDPKFHPKGETLGAINPLTPMFP